MGLDRIANAVWNIQLGYRFPYDADPEEDITLPDGDWALIAARGVIASLLDRRGIDNELENVDYDTRREIVQAIADIIRVAHDDTVDHEIKK